MCGICFIYSQKNIHNIANDEFCNLLSCRGPDASSAKNYELIDKSEVYLRGDVLWLQGSRVQKQPICNDTCALLWNGDVFDGLNIAKDENDTKHLFNHLQNCDVIEVSNLLSQIKGPYSFIYYNHAKNVVCFGRDILGRTSLLWNEPDIGADIILTSVSHRNAKLKEVPPYGIFYINLISKGPLSLVPWSGDTLDSISCHPFVSKIHISSQRIISPISTLLCKDLPSKDVQEWLDTFPNSLDDKESLLKILQLLEPDIENFIDVFTLAIKHRIEKCPSICHNCYPVLINQCNHCKIAVLFSGGVDSAFIALTLDSCLPKAEQIDLINVAFEMQITNQKKGRKCLSIETCQENLYNVPDRQTGLYVWEQLKEIRSNRVWNFVEVNVSRQELECQRGKVITHLVAPKTSVLDDSIGCALYFSARGKGRKICEKDRGKINGMDEITLEDYTSPARVLLCGMGADEQLCGYSRHRRCFAEGGWGGLLAEVEREVKGIHERNLGRDNRVMSHFGRAPRFPFLDEDVISYLNSRPLWRKTHPYLPQGVGDKLLLRASCASQGLTRAASKPKKAIQFGSKIAKLEDSKEKGNDMCIRLCD